MIPSQQRERVGQSGHRWLRRVDVRRSSDNHPAGCRSNSDQGQTGQFARIRSWDTNFSISDRFLRKGIVAVESVTEPQFICKGRSEDMNVLNGSHAIIKSLVGSISGDIRPCAPKVGQRQELRRIGEEEFDCQRITVGEPKISVRIELVFLEAGGRRVREQPICLRRWNHELAIGKLRIEQRQRSRINRGYAEGRLQGCSRPVVGEPRSDENIGRNAVDNGCRISLASALVGHKEEGFVFPDRASEYASKNIPPQQRAREASGLQEWIVRVERFIPEILISVSMDFIATALRYKLDVGPAAPASRGVIEGSMHFEFINGFRSWNRNQDRSIGPHRGC